MQLKEILRHHLEKERYKYKLSSNSNFYYVEEEQFYIEPDFYKISNTEQIDNIKFILFSAPGATGKSALAKYISYKYNAIYWDLSKIHIGSNTFNGTIISSMGTEEFSKFKENLKKANTLIVIDAFDEAEIISGRARLADFITEISKDLDENTPAPVVLLSRTETAHFISSFCEDNNIRLSHYEIGFFECLKAKQFIECRINNTKGKITKAEKDCINDYYSVVKSNISDEEENSFLGYAPVLEAIAEHISGAQNTAILVNGLRTKKDGSAVIEEIMTELLTREHKKFINAFKVRCNKLRSESINLLSIYSPTEQLVHLLYYIIFEEISYINYNKSNIPAEFIDEYQEMIQSFINQHPFIQNKFKKSNTKIDFSGPAFRDYALAKLILIDEYEQLALTYFEENDTIYLPTSIFFDCYMHWHSDCVNIKHINQVCKSFKAKEKAQNRVYIQCLETSDRDGKVQCSLEFSILDSSNNSNQYTQTTSIKFDQTSIYNIKFDYIANTSINMPSFVINLGNEKIDSRIESSQILCKSIHWNSKHITIDSGVDGCIIETLQNCTSNGAAPSFDILREENLKISLPNISHYYKLIQYKYDFENLKDDGLDNFSHAIKAILIEFRSHKKDTLAKDSERIRNVTVGNSIIKNKVLKYLLKYGILYEEEHLFKVNIEKSREKEINFDSLRKSEGFPKAYKDFLEDKEFSD